MAQFPTKVGEYLSQGVPICTNKNLPEISDLLEDFKAGKVINNSFSEESFTELVELIDKNKFFAKNAFQLWNSKLKFNIASKNYQRIYG